MKYVRLGKSALMVSRIGLGAMSIGSPKWRPWVMDEAASRPIIRRAVELGINFFDTSDYYSGGASEEVLGRALKDFANRSEVVIATKVGNAMGKGVNERGFSRKHLIAAAEASLKRLGTDHIDLYQTHIWDPTTPIDELIEAFHHLIRTGKVLYVGAAGMPAWQFAKSLYLADLRGWTRMCTMQNHYNAVYREDERELLPLCRAEGVGVIPFSPLGRGFLTSNRKTGGWDKTQRARTDEFTVKWYGRDCDYRVVDAMEAVAKRRGMTVPQVALSWVLHRPGIAAPILGVTEIGQLDPAVAVVDRPLEAEDVAAIDGAYEPRGPGAVG
ncbi:MAG: aldo/keto reductase [Alphaproteobacteria bacterium]|nr:aldo/keto reductase [Alphaproteobacteria bacterium]